MELGLSKVVRCFKVILGVELPLEQVYSQDLSDIWLTAGLFMLVTRARGAWTC